MDEKTLQTLEFDKVLSRLAGYTSFSAGRELALSLRPSTDRAEVVRRQRMTAEARRLLRLKPDFGLGGAHDVRPAVHKAALGGVLLPSELLEVHSTLRSARSVRGNLTRLAGPLPLLAELAKGIADLPAVLSAIGGAISPRAEVLDAASPVLAELRREIKLAHDRLTARLEALVASPAAREALQEPIVTLRNGRYVVPVKAEERARLRGIVHDVSASGATVFVEPLAVVDLANRWRELQLEEEREVERVLRRLSGMVGERAAEIERTVELLAQVDVALAAARYGEALGAADLPDASQEQAWIVEAPAELRIVEGRHPLLRGHVVPTTIRVGGGYTVLLITGPNTGGKTVALKTAGLLSLMAQAGLPVPAEAGTQIPVFSSVHADIGDEQSIEQSLSTFSSHMTHIIEILRSATRTSLVLLDELAAGTDPEEGAALARAILMELLERGCAAVATTHHGELKVFAHNTPGIMNASVEFDPETLAPTYRLTIGLPGRSNALAIARRLGMPEHVVRRAREAVAPEQAEVEDLLAQIQRERDEAAAARRTEELARSEAEAIRQGLEARLADLEARRDAILDETRRRMERELAETRERLAEAARRLERAASAEDLAAAAGALEAVERQAGRLRRRAAERRARRPRAGGVPLSAAQPGDLVYVHGVPQPGEVVAGPDERGEVEVLFGLLRTRVKPEQVERVQRPAAPARPASGGVVLPPAPQVGMEIEVRGQRAEEALPRVESFLDDAYRSGLPFVRIIHGKGTGTLRRVVRDALARHPLVRSYETAAREEGGEGVTVAHLAVD